MLKTEFNPEMLGRLPVKVVREQTHCEKDEELRLKNLADLEIIK